MYKVARDAQHVCVLRQLQEILLQLLLVPGDLTHLHLQPLQLLLHKDTEEPLP